MSAWFGQSVVNKPYLAVDAENRVYVTDPEGYLVIVFSHDGELLATFGRYGFDQNSFSLPTGIEVDAGGTIHVTPTPTITGPCSLSRYHRHQADLPIDLGRAGPRVAVRSLCA